MDILYTLFAMVNLETIHLLETTDCTDRIFPVFAVSYCVDTVGCTHCKHCHTVGCTHCIHCHTVGCTHCKHCHTVVKSHTVYTLSHYTVTLYTPYKRTPCPHCTHCKYCSLPFHSFYTVHSTVQSVLTSLYTLFTLPTLTNCTLSTVSRCVHSTDYQHQLVTV